jgi:hypothetical protein
LAHRKSDDAISGKESNSDEEQPHNVNSLKNTSSLKKSAMDQQQKVDPEKQQESQTGSEDQEGDSEDETDPDAEYEDSQVSQSDRNGKSSDGTPNDADNQTIDSLKKKTTLNGGRMPEVDTMGMSGNVDLVGSYKLYDFLFPGGNMARLAKIQKMVNIENSTISSILGKFKFDAPAPVIVLAGARDSKRLFFYEGIARAAFRTDAVIVDSGVRTGLEMAALRRNLSVVGVFPASQVTIPKNNSKPTADDPNELTSGHTHLFSIEDKLYQKWENEAKLKLRIAEKYFFCNQDENSIAKGSESRRAQGYQPCKVVMVVIGDDPNIKEEIKIAVNMNLSIIVIRGTKFTDEIIDHINGDKLINSDSKILLFADQKLDMKTILERGNFFPLETQKTEDISAFAHFFLTVSPF